MKSKLDFNTILNQTSFGLDIRAMLVDIEHFIEFSERNLAEQKRQELRRTKQECDEEEFEDPSMEGQYRHQMLESVEYRFEVSLKQRVRYAGLTALITTIEWCLLALKKRAVCDLPKKPNGINEAVHILSVFNKRADLDLMDKVQLLARLVRVRNCIIHAAGLLEGFKYEEQLRKDISSLHGIVVSKDNFLGESIALESGFLEKVTKNAREWLPSIEKAMYTQGLLGN